MYCVGVHDAQSRRKVEEQANVTSARCSETTNVENRARCSGNYVVLSLCYALSCFRFTLLLPLALCHAFLLVMTRRSSPAQSSLAVSLTQLQ